MRLTGIFYCDNMVHHKNILTKYVYTLEHGTRIRRSCCEKGCCAAGWGFWNRRSSEYSVREVVRAGVKIAKEAVQGTETKVALAAGPLSVLLEPYGDLAAEEAAALYEEQLGAGMEEQPDCIILETFMDLEMMRVAATVAKRYGLPVFCMMTFEKSGKTMMGNSVQDIVDTLEPVGIDGIGMNCSLGPDLALPVIREFLKKPACP